MVGLFTPTCTSNPEIYIAEQLEINSFQVLPIELKHTFQTYYLPNHHKDPFDRILVAQSQVENLPLLTLDTKITLVVGAKELTPKQRSKLKPYIIVGDVL